jgi:integrase
VSITRTTKGYTIRWYDRDGRERQRTYRGIDRQEAVQLERKILAERDRGEAQPDERQAPIFGTLADQWVEQHRPRWKPSTRSQYEQILKVHLRPAFGDTKITNISEASARQLVTKLHDAGLGARRINLAIIVFKMILRSGRKFLREDPLLDVKMLPEPHTEVDPLSPDEVDVFLTACRSGGARTSRSRSGPAPAPVS